MKVPSYTKVITLGATGTAQALNGHVLVEEKVDGSLFGFGIDENGEVGCRSHHKQIILDDAGMFAEAVAHVQAITPVLRRMFAVRREPMWFYCEYLKNPRHNTLSYGRTPRNHLVLFDARFGPNWLPYAGLQAMAHPLEIDVIPLLYAGDDVTLDMLKGFLQRESYLGGQTIEGVVVKNYDQLIAIGGNTFPLFCKHVSDAFKERNATNWQAQTKKSKLQMLMESYRTIARWQKAVQHLKERGELKGEPSDIGPLMREIARDLLEEEKETIKEELFDIFWKDIVRATQHGAPEWYKALLLESVGQDD
jgi:hypothetical protein